MTFVQFSITFVASYFLVFVKKIIEIFIFSQIKKNACQKSLVRDKFCYTIHKIDVVKTQRRNSNDNEFFDVDFLSLSSKHVIFGMK